MKNYLGGLFSRKRNKFPTFAVLCAGLATVAGLYGFQREFRVYRSMEPYDDVQLPPDWQDKAEWIFARLMYPQHPRARFGRYFGWGNFNWLQGGTSWTQDYPRADRHFAIALRRLTRLQVRSVEQQSSASLPYQLKCGRGPLIRL